MSVQRLPLRIRPIPSESLAGFLIRLAERNRVPKPQLLARSIGSPFSTVEATALGRFNLKPMAHATGVDLATLASMTYWPIGRGYEVSFLAATVDASMISLKHRRACPLCLSQGPFHRAVWDLRLATACPRHKVRLIDRCQECGRHLRWNTPAITRCICGASIRAMKAEPVPASELGGLSFVHGALHLDGFPVPRLWPVSTLSFADALSMLLHLGWFGSGARQRYAPVLLPRRDLYPHHYLQTGLDACRDWPTSFYRYLEVLCERATAPYWRATRLRLLAEWVADPARSEPLQRLLLPAFQAFMNRGCDPRAVYHLERVFMSRLS